MHRATIVAVLVVVVLGLRLQAGDPPPFVGGVVDVGLLTDRSPAVLTADSIYRIDKTPSIWKRLKLSVADRPVRIAGGAPDKFYIITRDDDNRLSLQQVADPTVTMIRRDVGPACAFLTADLGCCSHGPEIDLTTDAGETWYKVNSISLNAPEVPIGIAWLGERSLVISGNMGTVAAYDLDVEMKSAKGRWVKKFDAPSSLYPTPDKGSIWAWMSDCINFRASDGAEMVRIVPKAEVESVSLGASYVYLAGLQGCYVWGVQNGASRRLGKLETEEAISKVFTFADHAYAISMDGDIFSLEELRAQRISVKVRDEMVPLTQPAASPWVSADQLRELGYWIRKVDPQTRQRIFAEANQKISWTPQQRFEWTIEKFKQAATDK